MSKAIKSSFIIMKTMQILPAMAGTIKSKLERLYRCQKESARVIYTKISIHTQALF